MKASCLLCSTQSLEVLVLQLTMRICLCLLRTNHICKVIISNLACDHMVSSLKLITACHPRQLGRCAELRYFSRLRVMRVKGIIRYLNGQTVVLQLLALVQRQALRYIILMTAVSRSICHLLSSTRLLPQKLSRCQELKLKLKSSSELRQDKGNGYDLTKLIRKWSSTATSSVSLGLSQRSNLKSNRL